MDQANSQNTAIGGSKQILFLIAGKLSALVLAFLAPMVLARFLSKDEYGYYAQFNAVTSFMVTIFAFSISNNLYYFFSRKKASEYRTLLGNSLLALECGAVLGCLLLCIPSIGKLITGEYLYRFLPDICIYLLLFIPVDVMEPFYILMRDNRVALWYPSAVMVSRTLFVIVFVIIFHSVQGVFWGINLKNALLLAVSMLYIVTRLKQEKRTGRWLSFSLFKEQFKYVAPAAVSALLFTFCNRLDKIICITFLTPAAYASYAIAFFGVPGLMDIFSSIEKVYLVDMSRAYADNDKPRVLKLLRRRTCIIYAFALPVLLGVGLYAVPVIRFIFTEKYLDAVGFFRVYLITFCFAVFGASLVIRASGRTILTTICYTVSAAICIPTTFLLVRNYGAWGGIISAVFSQNLPKMFQMAVEIRLLETTLRQYLPWKDFLRIAAVALLLLIPFAIQNHFFPLNIFFSGILGGLYLAAVFVWEIRHDLFLAGKDSVMATLNRFHLSWLSVCIR